MKRLTVLAAVTLAVTCVGAAGARVTPAPHSIVLFIPDGLRAEIVDSRTAPTMAAIRDRGVAFRNSHSLFPTFTMPNASAMATGHHLGDTGTFSNTIYTGYPVGVAGGSLTPFLESDPVLGDVDEHFAGDYLNELTVLRAAREQGFSTAIVGKLGPALVFDHTNRSGAPTIVVDDSTGSANGIPLSLEIAQRLAALGLPARTPPRGDNGAAGNATTPGATVANVTQQGYFVDVATKVLLPIFKERGKPFVLVFWSRDPDGSQHNQGDSLNRLVPGINGPTSLAAIKNADDNLARLRAALDTLGLADTTNIIIAADHGFATIAKESATSAAGQGSYADVPRGLLPPGFVALDLARELGLPLFDPDAKNAPIEAGSHPSRANGLIGVDPSNPDVVVAANGGSDLVYLPKRDRAVAARVVAALLKHDYVSGLFVDDSLGRFAGTLPLSAINLKGSALTPVPAIAVNFKTFTTGCGRPLLCTVEIADTILQQGQGMHGSFSRADTMNFMAAIGPDFKTGFVDEVPVSNADVGTTMARILGLQLPAKGQLVGRVLGEAMPGGSVPRYATRVLRSAESENGLRTVVQYQAVGTTRYFDAAGFPGRTVGLSDVATTGASGSPER
ncbi:MAG TPA: alkaline phosphatase family protein [Gemmatimonadales bacterium]|nr:alkaline phosphatase family protein [Gemmatimonadales bacterium]